MPVGNYKVHLQSKQYVPYTRKHEQLRQKRLFESGTRNEGQCHVF